MVAQELGQFLPVLAILVYAKFQILRELIVVLLVVVLILCNFIEELEALFYKVFADHLQDFALLKHLSGNVEWQVLGVDNTLHKVQVLRNQVFTVFHDEHSPHIELDVVLDFPVLKEVEWCSLWHKQECSELKLSLDREVFYGQMVFPVVCQGLVELSVFFLADVVRVAGPDRFGLVEFLKFRVLLFYLLLLLLVRVLILVFVFLIGINILQLRFFLFLVFLVFFLVFFLSFLRVEMILLMRCTVSTEATLSSSTIGLQ